jgi:holo-[acyl-carrier protein] synthase
LTFESWCFVIIASGIDFVENRRFRKALACGDWRFCDGIFSQSEIVYCQSGNHPALRYAACFAAKEAALKALGVTGGDLGLFREVELKAPRGRQKLVLRSRLKWEAAQLGVRHIQLAITQNSLHTTALVILET